MTVRSTSLKPDFHLSNGLPGEGAIFLPPADDSARPALFLAAENAQLLFLFDLFSAELQKRADRADQLVLFFLAGANFWEKHAKNRRKQAKSSAFLVLIFFVGKLVGANFYAFCNYGNHIVYHK